MDLTAVKSGVNDWVKSTGSQAGWDIFLNRCLQQVFTFFVLVVLRLLLASGFSMLEPVVHKWHFFRQLAQKSFIAPQ